MVTEVYRDFSGTATEFSNLPGPYTGVEVGRFFTSALEAGGGIFYSLLKGQSDAAEFSATGFAHKMQDPLNGPVQYNNRLYGPEVFARYHFGLNSMRLQTLSFSLKAGAGILFNESELFYLNRQTDEIIMGKGNGKHKTTKVSNGMFILGGGLGYNLSRHVDLKLAASVNMVGYDFLDVVHNYDAKGNRREVFGLFTDLSAGIAVKLNGHEKPNAANRGKVYTGSHLPFSPAQ